MVRTPWPMHLVSATHMALQSQDNQTVAITFDRPGAGTIDGIDMLVKTKLLLEYWLKGANVTVEDILLSLPHPEFTGDQFDIFRCA